MNLKCVLLDDELPALRYLRTLCEGFNGVEVIKAYNNPLKFIQDEKKLDYNLCVMDIEMPGMNGMTLASKLQNKAIIFTTAYREFAVDAFELAAVDYLVKPIKAIRLEKAFDKAYKYLDKVLTSETVQLNSSHGKVLLEINSIAIITVSDIDKRDKRVYYTNGQEIMLKNISFEQLAELLVKLKLVRINRQTIVAVKSIYSFTHNQLLVRFAKAEDGFLKLPLNEHYRKNFMEALES